MNWNQLHYILTVAEEQNITRAAEKLYISQPSLSLSIKSLEHELGTPLFERRQGTMTCTHAGELFCKWASSTLRSHQQLQIKLSDISKDRRHRIRLGISPHRSIILTPPILERFYELCPNCELYLAEHPTTILKEQLEQDKLDFIIDIPHSDTVNFQNDLLAEERILLAVPVCFSGYLPKSSRDTAITLEQLESLPFILLPEDQVLGRMTQTMFETAGIHPEIRIICNSQESALILAARQLGITFVPEIFANERRFTDRVCYYPIRDFQSFRQICLVYHKGRYHHRSWHLLRDLFREMAPVLYQTTK